MAEDLNEIHERLGFGMTEMDRLADLASAFLEENLERWHRGGSGMIKLKKPIPTEIKVMSGNIAHEQRACLDALACVLARRNDPECRIDDTSFPIFATEAVFDEYARKRSLRRVNQKDFDAIRGIEPWKGGNDTLWALHTADITRKHRHLNVFGAKPTSALMRGFTLAGGSFSMADISQVEVGREVEVFRIENGFLDYDIDFHILFGGQEELRDRQMVNGLRGFHREVVRIVRLFE